MSRYITKKKNGGLRKNKTMKGGLFTFLQYKLGFGEIGKLNKKLNKYKENDISLTLRKPDEMLKILEYLDKNKDKNSIEKIIKTFKDLWIDVLVNTVFIGNDCYKLYQLYENPKTNQAVVKFFNELIDKNKHKQTQTTREVNKVVSTSGYELGGNEIQQALTQQERKLEEEKYKTNLEKQRRKVLQTAHEYATTKEPDIEFYKINPKNNNKNNNDIYEKNFNKIFNDLYKTMSFEQKQNKIMKDYVLNEDTYERFMQIIIDLNDEQIKNFLNDIISSEKTGTELLTFLENTFQYEDNFNEIFENKIKNTKGKDGKPITINNFKVKETYIKKKYQLEDETLYESFKSLIKNLCDEQKKDLITFMDKTELKGNVLVSHLENKFKENFNDKCKYKINFEKIFNDAYFKDLYITLFNYKEKFIRKKFGFNFDYDYKRFKTIIEGLTEEQIKIFYKTLVGISKTGDALLNELDKKSQYRKKFEKIFSKFEDTNITTFEQKTNHIKQKFILDEDDYKKFISIIEGLTDENIEIFKNFLYYTKLNGSKLIDELEAQITFTGIGGLSGETSTEEEPIIPTFAGVKINGPQLYDPKTAMYDPTTLKGAQRREKAAKVHTPYLGLGGGSRKINKKKQINKKRNTNKSYKQHNSRKQKTKLSKLSKHKKTRKHK
jgi:hypothetical protein